MPRHEMATGIIVIPVRPWFRPSVRSTSYEGKHVLWTHLAKDETLRINAYNVSTWNEKLYTMKKPLDGLSELDCYFVPPPWTEDEYYALLLSAPPSVRTNNDYSNRVFLDTSLVKIRDKNLITIYIFDDKFLKK